MKEFLALHNRTVTRTEIEAVIEAAKEQQNTAVIYRLSRILNAHPSTNSFVINIRQYPETQGLSGAQHTSDYREALDENGRLRKGYKFVKGKIIPTQPSHPSQDDEITFLAAAGIDYLPEAPDDEPQGLGKPVPAADIYKMVTDKVISMFKNAKISDYKRAWKDDQFFIPLNYDSKKPYRGVNRLLLEENIGIIGSFANPYFLTFKQIKKHGGKLKKGSKGYEVIYYSFIYSVPAAPNRKALKTTEVADVIAHLQKYNLPESVVKRVPLLRYYRVFNGKDVEGIQFNLQEVKIGRAVPDNAPENQAAQSIVENYPNAPEIKHGGNRAYYSPPADYVQMPNASNFDSANDYYRTLFHELIHSTGHPSRLNRELNTNHKSEAYAKEELTAEMGAVFLSAWAGILWYNNKNHAAYLKSWNNAIKEAENDSKFIMRAAAAAQKATDHILNLDANGQPAFLSQYEKPKKKDEKPSAKITIIPPYPIYIESDEENDDYMQLEIELNELMGDDFDTWAKKIIDNKRKERLKERSKEIKDNIYPIRNEEIGDIALDYNEKEKGYKYIVRKKGDKKYEFKLDIYRFGRFNEYESYSGTFKTPEECSNFIIKTIDEKNGFYYRNWYGLSELQNKINELKGYQYSTQFHYPEEEEEPKSPTPPTAPKPTKKNPEKFPAAGTTKVFFTSQVDEIVDYVKKNGDNRGYINIDFTDKQTLKTLSQYGWGTYGFINTYDYPESAPKSKTKGVMSLKKIVSKDELRPTLTGVYIDKDYYIATNAISLIWVPRPKNDEYKTGWIFDANFKCKKLGGCKIEDYLINSDRFPIDRIREMQKAPIAYTSQQIDLTTLLDHLYRGYKAIRAINNTQEAIVITLQADKKIQYIDLKILIDLLDALRTNGAQTITFGFENLSGNSPIHISTDTQLQGFVMPRIFDENKVPTIKNCLMIAPLPLTLTEISKPTKGLSAPTDGTLFGKYPEINKRTKFKSYDIGTKISKTSHTTESEKSQSAFVKRSLATNNKAKIVPNSLNLPDTPNLAAKMVALQARNWESFKIANPQMQRFLGDVELKESESTVITIGGGAGSGKTRFAFQFINALAQNYKVGHASLEEHPDSKLYYDKVKQYLDPTAMANVEAPEIKNLQQLDELIQRNEVIVIDSFAKLRELDSRFMLDRDLRKKYNSKLFLLIYQLTGEGKMRGGSESEFDGDIILLTHVSPDYRENYIYPKKNRYNALPATQLRYSTYYQQMLPTEDTLSGIKEASNNTYEIVY